MTNDMDSGFRRNDVKYDFQPIHYYQLNTIVTLSL
jgi:hypothetical protein